MRCFLSRRPQWPTLQHKSVLPLLTVMLLFLAAQPASFHGACLSVMQRTLCRAKRCEHENTCKFGTFNRCSARCHAASLSYKEPCAAGNSKQ
mmetsp:Transcript_43500/g.83511  ORF Transcript_43500/g.83511 Transcript_43500/m.83511 type:complete len:92 (+) Transcript_43500:3186-3461(+)